MSRLVARLRQLLPSLLVPALLLFTPDGADAQEWSVNKAQSSVALQLSMDGQPVEARFGAYKFEISLDPEEAADGKIAGMIDASSLSTGDAARDAVLYGPDWLNAAAHPTIRLTSVRIREQEAPAYRLDADLTLRGVTKRVSAPLTVTDEGTAGKIYAELKVSPAAFGVGGGAGEMRIVINLTATHLTN